MWIKVRPSYDVRHVFDEELGVEVSEERGAYDMVVFRPIVAGELGQTSYASFHKAKKAAVEWALNKFGPRVESLKRELSELAEEKCDRCLRKL